MTTTQLFPQLLIQTRQENKVAAASSSNKHSLHRQAFFFSFLVKEQVKEDFLKRILAYAWLEADTRIMIMSWERIHRVTQEASNSIKPPPDIRCTHEGVGMKRKIGSRKGRSFIFFSLKNPVELTKNKNHRNKKNEKRDQNMITL